MPKYHNSLRRNADELAACVVELLRDQVKIRAAVRAASRANLGPSENDALYIVVYYVQCEHYGTNRHDS